MAFYCKPSGGYGILTPEGTNNVIEYDAYMENYTTQNNVVGQLCNIVEESGLNPWRWQDDTFDLSMGYGLYQFTPASGYINLSGIPGHSPNMSTTQILGGDPTDANGQMYVFANNTLSKWVSRCWRKYWNVDNTWEGAPLYPALWVIRNRIVNTYGDGSSLSMAQFFSIDNYQDACFAFLACFEGPQVPNLDQRLSHANDIYTALGGVVPGGVDPKKVILMKKYKREELY